MFSMDHSIETLHITKLYLFVDVCAHANAIDMYISALRQYIFQILAYDSITTAKRPYIQSCGGKFSANHRKETRATAKPFAIETHACEVQTINNGTRDTKSM